MRSQVTQTVSDCVAILRQLRSIRRSLSHSVFQSFVAALVLTKLDFGNATLAGIPSFQTPGGHECSGSTRLPVQSTRPHHSAALPSALASCARANSVQTRRADVPVCPWTGAGLPGGRSTACRWTSWSTTPAFIIDLGTGCITDTAFHERRPSVPRRCSKNLEQSAIRSDVFKVQSVCEHLRLMPNSHLRLRRDLTIELSRVSGENTN